MCVVGGGGGTLQGMVVPLNECVYVVILYV